MELIFDSGKLRALARNYKRQYGDLELWDRDMTRAVQRIAPVFNRCVIFNVVSHTTGRGLESEVPRLQTAPSCRAPMYPTDRRRCDQR